MNFIVDIVTVLLAITIYLLPAIIGFIRKKDNKIMLVFMNILLGWTIIGWVVLLLEAADII